MKWLRKRTTPAPSLRSNDEILHAYHNNNEVTRDECRALYDLVDDPWDLGSSTHYESFARLIKVTDKYIDWKNTDWIVDYGSGVGTFTKALKDAYPHIKSIGIDFDIANTAAETRYGDNLFDYYYSMDTATTEYDLLEYDFPNLDIHRMCICFINSSYYVFKDQRRRKRIQHLMRLIRRFEGLAQTDDLKYLLVSAECIDRAAIDAITQLGPDLAYLSRDLTLASRIDQFNSELDTRIWTR